MTFWFIGLVTLGYAAYNLAFKLSGAAIPESATTTVLATIALQFAALSASLVLLAVQFATGEHSFKLSLPSYAWAFAGGLAIGSAEILYLYLFSGLGGAPANANTAVPVIVGGTVVLTTLFAVFVLGEKIGLVNVIGMVLVLAGLVMVVQKPA